MTASIRLREITAAIAALDVDGLTIYDLDRMPEQVNLPCLFPEPINFVGEMTVAKITLGIDGSRALDLAYTLTYTLWYKPAAGGYTLATHYPALVDLAVDAVGALATADLSAYGCISKDVTITGGTFGVVPDPAGNPGFGCKIAIKILEFIQG